MTDYRGFFDLTCPRCGRRMGWRGQYEDRPRCPGCGFHPELKPPPKPPCRHTRTARATSGKLVCAHCHQEIKK